jgi:ubiquinone/menaquinone biosynthesis C-methylase UbiE
MPSRSPVDSQSAYDAWHEGLSAEADSDSAWHGLVLGHLPPIPMGARILEIGCGRGGFSIRLANLGEYEVVGADFSEAAITHARARARGRKNLLFELQDIQNLTYDSASFDLVISCETIEHVPRPLDALHELARVLAPGGRLLLTTPNYVGVMGLYRTYRAIAGRPYDEGGQPINNVTLLPITKRWVRAVGLEIEVVDATGHYFPIPGRLAGPKPLQIPSVLARVLRPFALHSLVGARKPLERDPGCADIAGGAH